MVDVLLVSALRVRTPADSTRSRRISARRRRSRCSDRPASGSRRSINRLLGHEALRTGAISDADGKGRHTTTARQLVELPGGALLIDTPGMRELQPWADESAVDAAFDDIAALAAECRFADCGARRRAGMRRARGRGRRGASTPIASRTTAASGARRRSRSASGTRRPPSKQKRRWKQIHQAQKALYRIAIAASGRMPGMRRSVGDRAARPGS